MKTYDVSTPREIILRLNLVSSHLDFQPLSQDDAEALTSLEPEICHAIPESDYG
jgi:hypothetical protein